MVTRVASVQEGAQCQVKDMALQSGPGNGAAGVLQAMTTFTVAPRACPACDSGCWRSLQAEVEALMAVQVILASSLAVPSA